MYLFSVPVALQNRDEISSANLVINRIKGLSQDIICGFHALEYRKFLSESAIQSQFKNVGSTLVFEVHAPFDGEDSLMGDCKNLINVLDISKRFVNNLHFHVSYHVGILLSTLGQIREFSKEKRGIYNKIVSNFGMIADKAKENSIEITIENIPPFILNGEGLGEVIPFFIPFSTFDEIRGIIKDVGAKNIHFLLDSCHWVIQNSMESKLKGTKYERMLFQMSGIENWEEFTNSPWKNIVREAYAYHLCNSTGPGVNLPPNLSKKWGEHGTVKGLLSKEDFKGVLNEMSKNKKHALIEVKQNPRTFAESFEFAKWIIS